jgi:hypothetical protein
VRRAWVALVAALAAPAGCGGASAPSDEDVIRGWTAAIRTGSFDRADDYFALPALVANGGRPLRLRTRAEIDLFNRTLPCGAVVLATQRASGHIVATFRLTERSGPGAFCGAGTGHTAQVAFLVRAGHIVEWLRVIDPGRGSGDDVSVEA